MRERLVDDDRSGAGTSVSPVEAAPGDNRTIEGLEEPGSHLRRPEHIVVRRPGVGRGLDFSESYFRHRPGRAVGERDRDNAGFLRDASLEFLERPRPPRLERRRGLLLERPVHVDASREILSAWKFCANLQGAQRLDRTLQRDRDADGRQRHLNDHRACPDAPETQRGATGAPVREVRLHARFRGFQCRQE